MARTPQPPPTTLRLDKWEEEIQAAAARLGITKNEYLRRAIRRCLDGEPGAKKAKKSPKK